VVVDNLVNGKPLVYLEDVSDFVVEDAGQVILVNCDRIRVENLNLSNTDVGAQLWNTNNTIITGNNIKLNGFGVHLESSSNNNTISGNNITNNYHWGIRLYNSTFNIVSENNIANNYIGVVLEFSSSNNTISGNNITNNNWFDLLLGSSPFNVVYHNNFDNNPLIYLFNSTSNTWDNGCEGNFWTNYNGADLDNDGVGDTYLPWEGVDNYPLMNPYWNPTDINHDLTVDIFDVVLAVGAYSSTPSDLNWNCHCDVAEPYGIINIFDIVTIIGSYGEEYTP